MVTRRLQLPIIILLCLVIFILLLFKNRPRVYPAQEIVAEPDPRVKGEFKEWKKCIEDNIAVYDHNARGLWSHLRKAAELCEKLPFMANLRIGDFRNLDETKHHIPSLKDPSIIVTLGIGHDTRAEEALLKVLPKSSKFYGADPVYDVNEELYTKFGYYFPFAVGGKSQISIASVLINNTYVNRHAAYVDFEYFLSQILGHKVYDDVWIDVEGAEYDMFPYFYRGGKLDQSNVTLCQFNLEVHSPDDEKKEKFREFIFRILKENRYAFFRPFQLTHIRLYFLNFSDRDCVSKYILST